MYDLLFRALFFCDDPTLGLLLCASISEWSCLRTCAYRSQHAIEQQGDDQMAAMLRAEGTDGREK